MSVKREILQQPFLRCIIFLGILVTVFKFLSPHFFSVSNLENIFSASAVTGLLALGATFVIASGGIDLSIASVMALSGTVCASLLQHWVMPPEIAMALCIIIGGASGVLTGIFIHLTRAPSFIVTLGMLSVARAISYIISEGTPIYGLPETVTQLGQEDIFGFPGPMIILILGCALSHVILHRTQFGIQTLIFGDNPFAAKAMGLKIGRLQTKIYGLCGAYAGLAGFVFMARTNAGDPTAGQNYELVAITAVILGGTKLYGGQATILGTLLGVLCLGVLQNGLNLLAVSTYYQVLFVGMVLLGSAFLERVGENR